MFPRILRESTHKRAPNGHQTEMALITDKQMQTKPSAEGLWYYESFARGSGSFCGRITPAGERLFYFRYTDSKGARHRYPIGSYCPKGANGLTLAQAREKAQELSRAYRAGAKNLREHLEAEKLANQQAIEEANKAKARRKTIRTVFEDWISKELKPRVNTEGKRQGRKDSGAYTRRQFERHVFPTIGDTPMEEVKKADILDILDKLRDNGTLRTANVVLSDLKQFFSFALDREIIGTNPTATLSKKRHGGGDDVVRERFLSEDEIRDLAKKLPDSGLAKRTAIAVKLQLATICRIDELVTARWENVHISDDGKDRHWYLPETKNQRDHTIHLSDFALEQFKALRALQEASKDDAKKKSPWVFPNTASNANLDKKTVNKQLADRQRTADTPMKRRTKNMTALALKGGKWRTHDLRRTGATMMARLGFSLDVIHECQNHLQTDKMARVYIKDRRIAEQRLAFNALGERLDALFKDQTLADVIPFQTQDVA